MCDRRAYGSYRTAAGVCPSILWVTGMKSVLQAWQQTFLHYELGANSLFPTHRGALKAFFGASEVVLGVKVR